jgi:hypothetical protein
MKNVKGFLSGFVVALLLFSSIGVFAAVSTQSIDVLMNSINIAINGEVKGNAGESYQLSNGGQVPFSIVYKGTTYLPLRKVAELLDKEVTWNGDTNTAGVKEKKAEPNQSENSRLSPANIGEKLTLQTNNSYSENYSLEMTLTEIVRGNEAESIVQNANQFNDGSGSDKEYILAKFKIKMLATENDAAIDINNSLFDAVSQNGVVYDDFISVAGLSPSLATEYYQGSEYEGYVYFLVNNNDQALARFKIAYEEYIWFELFE